MEKEGGTGYHSFSNEEKKSFADIISYSLKSDPNLTDLLPIDPETDDLFTAVGNGILLWYIKLNPFRVILDLFFLAK